MYDGRLNGNVSFSYSWFICDIRDQYTRRSVIVRHSHAK